MKSILVPTDFSVEATHAWQTAQQIAKQHNAELIALYVLELLIPHSLEAVPEIAAIGSSNDEAKLREAILSHMQKTLTTPDGLNAKHLVASGDTFKTISDVVAEQKCELIVMGSQGSSGLKQVLIGSNAEKVLRKSHCPVLITKDETHFENIKEITFPTDTSLAQDKVVSSLKTFLNNPKVLWHLLTVNTHYTWKDKNQMMTELIAFAKRNKLSNYTTNVLASDYVEDGIITFAENVDADLIAMATHSRTGFAHLVGGSVAGDLANHAKRPLWAMSLKAN